MAQGCSSGVKHLRYNAETAWDVSNKEDMQYSAIPEGEACGDQGADGGHADGQDARHAGAER